MRRGVFALVPVLLAATPAGAAQWIPDPAKSHLGFTVVWDKEPFSGEFKRWTAEIAFDPTDLPHAKAEVTVDLASEESDEADFDEGLKGALGFEVAKFPRARFETTRIVQGNKGGYVAEGKLELRGIAKSVTLPFTLTLSGETAHMRGKAVVMRTDFGVGRGMWEAPAPVAHAVTVTVDLYATKAK